VWVHLTSPVHRKIKKGNNILINIDFERMQPVPDGAHRDGLFGLQPFYIGGRKDGQSVPAGYQPFHRFETGQPMEDDQQPPDRHYVLFADGRSLRYIHSSLVPADYKYTEDPASE